MKPIVSWALSALILTTIVVVRASLSPLFASQVHIRQGSLPHYRVTDLGRLRSSIFVMPQAINNLGQVAGWEKGTRGAVDRHAYLWQHGRYTDLGPGAAYAINNHGQIVGQKERLNAAVPYAPFCNSYLWEKGKYTFIGSPPPSDDLDTGFSAIAINDKGWVLGNESSSLWHDGTIQKTMPEIYGTAINNAGDVAGFLLDSQRGGDSSDTPNLRRNSQIIILGNPPSEEVGFPSAVNNHDVVVGNFSYLAYDDGPSQAFNWQAGKMTLLPACKGDSYTIANAVNNLGQIAGKSGPEQGYSRAVIWNHDLVIDLNTLIPHHTGWILESAHAINDKGQIVGVGTHNGRHFRAFLLTLTR